MDWVSFSRCVAALLCVLFSKFLRSSNILSDIHSVSSILSERLTRSAEQQMNGPCGTDMEIMRRVASGIS